MRHLWLDQPETSNHSLITFAQAENRVLKVLVLEYPDAKHLNTLAKGAWLGTTAKQLHLPFQ
jgi:hypothetical protein